MKGLNRFEEWTGLLTEWTGCSPNRLSWYVFANSSQVRVDACAERREGSLVRLAMRLV